jgi:hypothetical protein
MEVTMSEQKEFLDPTQGRSIRSCFEWSPVGVVARAISQATEDERSVYAERLGSEYRWSLVHPGSAYPLLRITARYLRIDYTKMFIGFRTLDNGPAILWDERADQTPPDRWEILAFDKPTGQAEVEFSLRLRLDETSWA